MEYSNIIYSLRDWCSSPIFLPTQLHLLPHRSSIHTIFVVFEGVFGRVIFGRVVCPTRFLGLYDGEAIGEVLNEGLQLRHAGIPTSLHEGVWFGARVPQILILPLQTAYLLVEEQFLLVLVPIDRPQHLNGNGLSLHLLLLVFYQIIEGNIYLSQLFILIWASRTHIKYHQNNN